MENILKYETICIELALEFAKKQNLDLDFWVADIIGDLASFSGEYCFNMSDIVYDIKTNQPKYKIIEWQNYIVENYLKDNSKDYKINYSSYCKGIRF